LQRENESGTFFPYFHQKNYRRKAPSHNNSFYQQFRKGQLKSTISSVFGEMKHDGPIIMGVILYLPIHRVISSNSGFSPPN